MFLTWDVFFERWTLLYIAWTEHAIILNMALTKMYVPSLYLIDLQHWINNFWLFQQCSLVMNYTDRIVGRGFGRGVVIMVTFLTN